MRSADSRLDARFFWIFCRVPSTVRPPFGAAVARMRPARGQSMLKSHRRLLCGALLALCAVTPAAALDVQSGIGFVAIQNQVEGTQLVLENAQHQDVASGLVDRLGSLVFRDLAYGAQYFVREPNNATTAATTLRFEDHPPASYYDAQPALVAGLNYIRMRDGTLLSAMVRAPLGGSLSPGHIYPTVVEYSGYAASDPDNPQPSTLLAQALGYATVAVNMRGSGCSGGIIDLFDLPTTADGYDIIEIVGRQSWALGKIGMVGISFPGISQMFVGGANPPHLAAIAPFSVIGDIYRGPGFPGGIFNNGFAETWLAERASDAEPAPEGGQSWAINRVNNGDTICLDNQKLRLQTQDPVAFTRDTPYYTPAVMDARSPITWAPSIEVPVFISGAWQDEQTGSGFVTLLKSLPKRRDVHIMLTNGVHSSPLEPTGLWNWIAFLDLYVGQRMPDVDRLSAFMHDIY
ncbi:MAG TPA: CocE/NonD family hydrolase, partial [Candidatus Limnocylindrales bacterium]|nr:CocE/NonD family hydrolase [Candidatus Limnocylindrales bacterium]